ncbi:hypothetical protein [Archangium lansingense]|uniref:Uncharacterized protein n=1 Tax=Archangium lansingense TaxID=2995310 RepID=A0ABT4A5P3_9BACT|nr:hypothetical protein [Archangium lansinium]MCY1076953.1 hypothetical protein [Archangium lansinium]
METWADTSPAAGIPLRSGRGVARQQGVPEMKARVLDMSSTSGITADG